MRVLVCWCVIWKGMCYAARHDVHDFGNWCACSPTSACGTCDMPSSAWPASPAPDPDPVVFVSKYRGDSDLEAVEVEELVEKPLGVVGLIIFASRDSVARWSDVLSMLLSTAVHAGEGLRNPRIGAGILWSLVR